LIDNKTLIDNLLRHATDNGNFATGIKGFQILRRDVANSVERCMIKPFIMMVLQGKKRTVLGEAVFEYGAGQSLVLGVDMPLDGRVLEASAKKPYLALLLELDGFLIAQVSTKLPHEDTNRQNLLAVACSDTEPDIYNAFARLSKLIDEPEHIPFLSPLILKEIYYHLLTGSLGKHIRAISVQGTVSNQVASAVAWLEKNYKTSLNVDKLAKFVGMPVSTFHRNFKLITSLSPLQFQKKLRLFEAQRLMLSKGVDATKAAYEVGYESHTQFSREYKRMFGNSPIKDIKDIISKTLTR
jgi:AraC-like DNA-binding protein